MKLDAANRGSEPLSPGAADRTRSWFERILLGPEGPRAGWRAAVYASLYFLFLFLLQFIESRFYYSPAPQPGELSAGQLFPGELTSVVCAIAAALIMGAMEGRRLGEYGLPSGGLSRRNFCIGAFWGIAQITVLMLLIRALGGYSFGARGLGFTGAAGYALVWFAVFFLVGMNEEFLFRGYLQFTLASGMGFWPAATLLSLLFGAIHLRNPGEGPIGALGVFVIGIFFCFTLWRTGDLWFAIGLHTAYDFGESYLYSVPDSGVIVRGHLLFATLHGPKWLTGGSVGPEGSAAAFVVMAAMFFLFDRVYRAPRANRPSAD